MMKALIERLDESAGTVSMLVTRDELNLLDSALNAFKRSGADRIEYAQWGKGDLKSLRAKIDRLAKQYAKKEGR
jgi:hypothetical protein